MLNGNKNFPRVMKTNRFKRDTRVCCANSTSIEGGLRRWIQMNGGFVHESLHLTDIAPCGARGVVASNTIDKEALFKQSLAIVPKMLHLDNVLAATAIKARLLDPRRHERVEALEQVQVVAAALVLERGLGSMSFWRPYLDSLPSDPPSPWLKSDTDLDLSLKGEEEEAQRWSGAPRTSVSGRDDVSSAGSGQINQQWRQAVQADRQRYEAMAAEALEVCQGALPRATGMQNMLWALAQVSSRSLGSGSSSGLVPFMDLLNHHPQARPPMLQLDDDDRLVMTCTNVREGELHHLEKGQELYLCYGEWGPLEGYLKFGFVPQ